MCVQSFIAVSVNNALWQHRTDQTEEYVYTAFLHHRTDQTEEFVYRALWQHRTDQTEEYVLELYGCICQQCFMAT